TSSLSALLPERLSMRASSSGRSASHSPPLAAPYRVKQALSSAAAPSALRSPLGTITFLGDAYRPRGPQRSRHDPDPRADSRHRAPARDEGGSAERLCMGDAHLGAL